MGHRGLGTSFRDKNGGSVRENTIASMKSAAAHGADMVEFDVQLSKDYVPIIYHDFQVCVSMRKKKYYEYSEMLELPVKELTLEQLQKLKVYLQNFALLLCTLSLPMPFFLFRFIMLSKEGKMNRGFSMKI